MNDNQARPLQPEELVSMYAGIIYRIAYSRLQNTHDAEDITQEVLIKYIRAGKTFRDEDHRRMWIIRVTVNAAHSLAGSAWRRRTTLLEEAENLPCPQQEPCEILEALKKLPKKYRIPIHLFYYENMTIRQIAAVLGCPEGTVKSLLSRGRKKLKILLEEGDYV